MPGPGPVACRDGLEWCKSCPGPAQVIGPYGALSMNNDASGGSPSPVALKRRILVADDEADIRRVVKRALEGSFPDVEVDTAADGAEALALVRQRPFDLVLTDLDMPRMNGQVLFEALHEHHPGVDVVVLTGKPSSASFEASLEAQVVEYLHKPLRMAELCRRIQGLLDARERRGAEALRGDALAALSNLERACQSFLDVLFAMEGERTLTESLESLNPHLSDLRRQILSLGTLVRGGES